MIFQQMKLGTKVVYLFKCDFDHAIHFLYYFHDSRSSSRSKNQISRSFKQNYYFYQIQLACVIPLFHAILTGDPISDIILIIQSHLHGQEVNYKVK